MNKNELRNLIKEQIFNETTDSRTLNMFDRCVEELGAESVLYDIVTMLDTETIKNYTRTIMNKYNINE